MSITGQAVTLARINNPDLTGPGIRGNFFARSSPLAGAFSTNLAGNVFFRVVNFNGGNGMTGFGRPGRFNHWAGPNLLNLEQESRNAVPGSQLAGIVVSPFESNGTTLNPDGARIVCALNNLAPGQNFTLPLTQVVGSNPLVVNNVQGSFVCP